MAITALSVSVDHEEYSRFEAGNDIITATIVPIPATGINNEQITIQLRKARRNRTSFIFTQTYTFGSGDYSTGIQVQIDLKSLMDDGTGDPTSVGPRILAPFSKVRRGMFFVHAFAVANPTIFGDSPDFSINIITVKEFKREYLFGLELSSHDIRKAKYQPQKILGVEITGVSRNHSLGFFELNYNQNPSPSTTPSSRGISWIDGDFIPTPRPGTYFLPNKQKSGYIIVQITNMALLPHESTVETILIEKDVIDDAALRNFINRSIDWAEFTALQVYLEPTHLVSDAAGLFGYEFANVDYDYPVTPLTMYPRKAGGWMDLQFPFANLLKISRLFGGVNYTKIIEARMQWLEMSEKGSFVQFVPFSQQFLFEFIGLIWVEALRGPVIVPNFWHYDVHGGLREVPGELRELIAKKAAIEVLAIAGQAFKSVIGSQRIGRDGVYEAVNYFNPGKGLYGAVISQYQEFIKDTVEKYKNKYRGPNLIVL